MFWCEKEGGQKAVGSPGEEELFLNKEVSE